MDIADVRRQALRRLIATTFGGVARQMALACQKPERQINDMLATPPRKSFGEKVARNIEESLGLPPLYLDQEAEESAPSKEQGWGAETQYAAKTSGRSPSAPRAEESRVYGLQSDEQTLIDGYRLADDGLRRTMLLLASDSLERFGRRRANHN